MLISHLSTQNASWKTPGSGIGFVIPNGIRLNYNVVNNDVLGLIVSQQDFVYLIINCHKNELPTRIQTRELFVLNKI